MLTRIHILHTNDLHSHFEQVPAMYSLVHRLRQEWKERNEEGLLLDIGDHLDRSQMETEGTEGMINRAILEAFKYQAITFGNNELLAYSPEKIAKVYQDVSFSVISTNIKELQSNKRPSWMVGWDIFSVDNIQIGMMAVTIPFTQYYREMGWELEDPMSALKEAVKKLRSKVTILILLSHVGILFDREVAKEITGIDLILGGHTHHLLNQAEKINKTWIAAAGLHGKYLGNVTVTVDDQTLQIKEMSANPIAVDQKDNSLEMAQIITQYKEIAQNNMSEIITQLSYPLDISWRKESDLANILADGLKNCTNAHLAIVNSGQLLGGIPAGVVTKQMIHQICPHPINPVMMKLKGEYIRKSLEQSLSYTYQSKEIRGYGFRGKQLGNMAISGLQVHVCNSGTQIQSIFIGDKKLKDEQEYVLATIDMFTFGVGYPNIQYGQVLKIYMREFLRDILSLQLKKPYSLDMANEQRWIFDDVVEK